jgi:hypothetical protein
MQAKHLLHGHHLYTLKTKSADLARFTAGGTVLRDGYRIRVYVDKPNNGQATTARQREIDSLNGVGTAAQPLTFAEKISQATAAAPKAKSSLTDNMQAALAGLPSRVIKTLKAATTARVMPSMLEMLGSRIATTAAAQSGRQAGC